MLILKICNIEYNRVKLSLIQDKINVYINIMLQGDYMKQLKGIHHVTAITSDAEKIYEFFTHILGLRLVKKTVNQDDIHTYHLFFADDIGSAGTDMTFFDFPGISKGRHGRNEIQRTYFRVQSDAALLYWKQRFETYHVEHEDIVKQFGVNVLPFEDFDGQLYALISDEGQTGVAPGTPWKDGPIEQQMAIVGLGPVVLNVSQVDHMEEILKQVYEMNLIQKEDHMSLFEMGEGGNGARVIIQKNEDELGAINGYGTVHHVAFRVDNTEQLYEWINRYNEVGLPNSGYVDRFYFKSLYARIPNGILFEIATDGPGFMEDEPYETLGESLSLPPKLEPNRQLIESEVRHIDTIYKKK